MQHLINFSKNQQLPDDYAVWFDDDYECYFWSYKSENDPDYIYDGGFCDRFDARRCALNHHKKRMQREEIDD